MGINFKVAAKLSQLRFLVFQGMAGKSPRVNNETGHWETYDNDAQDWADTGTKAQGEKGDPAKLVGTLRPDGTLYVSNLYSYEDLEEATF